MLKRIRIRIETFVLCIIYQYIFLISYIIYKLLFYKKFIVRTNNREGSY